MVLMAEFNGHQPSSVKSTFLQAVKPGDIPARSKAMRLAAALQAISNWNIKLKTEPEFWRPSGDSTEFNLRMWLDWWPNVQIWSTSTFSVLSFLVTSCSLNPKLQDKTSFISRVHALYYPNPSSRQMKFISWYHAYFGVFGGSCIKGVR